MPLAPIEDPPTPASHIVSPPIAGEETCEQIKARFGLKTQTHKANTSGKTKLNSKVPPRQSHHVLQDYAAERIIPRDLAIAVVLADSRGGSVHREVTNRQNERRDNKRYGNPGPLPATDFEGLKKQAREDLAAALEGRQNDVNTGDPMTPDEAKKVADCLVEEAAKAAKDHYDPKNPDEPLENDTPVGRPGGCFPIGTIIWLNGEKHKSIEEIKRGDVVETTVGFEEVIRTDRCRNDTIEICFDNWCVKMAPFHRVLLSRGCFRRADELQVGDWVESAIGSVSVKALRYDNDWQTVYSFGLDCRSMCRVGKNGLWVEVPNYGLLISRQEKLSPFHPLYTG